MFMVQSVLFYFCNKVQRLFYFEYRFHSVSVDYVPPKLVIDIGRPLILLISKTEEEETIDGCVLAETYLLF